MRKITAVLAVGLFAIVAATPATAGKPVPDFSAFAKVERDCSVTVTATWVNVSVDHVQLSWTDTNGGAGALDTKIKQSRRGTFSYNSSSDSHPASSGAIAASVVLLDQKGHNMVMHYDSAVDGQLAILGNPC